MANNGLQKAIISTLKYSNHFNFPLTAQEIFLRLISSEPCSKERVFGTLHSMVKTNKIEKLGKYYFLPGESNIVKQRLIYSRLSKPLRSYAESLVKNLTIFPTVKAIYLTGSLAMNNTDGHDDIDLMIVAKPGTLWTTRFLLTLYTTLLALRRTPHTKNIMGKLCLNLYLTPNSYALPPSHRSLYTAYELIQANPIYDPHNTRAALLFANPWIEKYLPNATRTVPKRNPRLQTEEGSPAGEGTVLNGILKIVEKICYRLQLTYMHSKITREYITPDAAFFHPHDPGADVLKKV